VVAPIEQYRLRATQSSPTVFSFMHTPSPSGASRCASYQWSDVRTMSVTVDVCRIDALE
jgi:hypothetical protein